ncbi:phage antirepressor YoqD-like protein [Pedobacter africanus]|uniref:Phage antirepressor YoqD-like protein n=1 Tax=Pedobacter africanus TaxID=151894 RepID=A0ACC6L0U1_9SPHI|nr:hypothetical protein [Pedobacter africanus]MDR6784953.1 phage antirepressor YoqD-like protein [Pedobacter africanus]
MKKIFSILGSLLFVTALKAQTVVKKETVNPGSSQATNSSTPTKDPKAGYVDPKKEAEAKIAAQMAAKDVKMAQKDGAKLAPAKDPKDSYVDPKKEAEAKIAEQMAAKDAKMAQKNDSKTALAKDPKASYVDPKKEAEAKIAAQMAAKDAKMAQQHALKNNVPAKDTNTTQRKN